MKGDEVTCSECGEDFPRYDVRPYGKDGAPVCFDCAMKPENRARTDEEFGKVLDQGDVLLTNTGPKVLK